MDWTKEKLQSWRLEGDPLADKVVADIIEHGHENEINELFLSLVSNVEHPNPHFYGLPDHLKKLVTDYFDESGEMPEWVDYQKLDRAAEVFGLYGPQINMLLMCRSLPFCYTCWRGAKVLYQTGRFLVHDGSMKSFTRRLMETAQFVVNVMSPNGFAEDGNAIVSIQKVRLIHAAIRYFTLKKNWDKEEYGIPINQQDLAGTHLSFTVVVLEGLEQLGVRLKPEELEAYYHLWKVVGHVLGLHKELNTDNMKDSDKLMQMILDSQSGPSKEGTELTLACIDFMEHVLPGKHLKGIPSYLMRYCIGNEKSKILKIPYASSFYGRVIVWILRQLTHIMGVIDQKHKIAAFAAEKFNRHFIQMMIIKFNEGKNVQFHIPDSLKEQWGGTKK